MGFVRWHTVESMLREVVPDLERQTALGEGFQLEVEGLESSRIHLVALRGDEGMNRLYRFDLIGRFSGHAEDAMRASALGRPLHLTLETSEGTPRMVHGIAACVSLLAHEREHSVAHVVLVPKLWLMGRTVDSRVFQDMDVRTIAAEILQEHGIVHIFRLARAYRRRSYVVQHEETDLAFLLRILAEEGIFLSFMQPHGVDELREAMATGVAGAVMGEVSNIVAAGGSEQAFMSAGARLAQPSALMQIADLQRPGEVLVLGDTPTAYAATPGLGDLMYRPGLEGKALHVDERHLPHFSMTSAIAPTRATVRDYDPYRAQRPAHGTVIGTLAPGVQGALADGVSAAVEAGTAAMGEATRALPEGIMGIAGPLAGAAGVDIDPGSALGALNESVSHGILTATHAVMAPEVAVARAAMAMAGELLDPLLGQTPLKGLGAGAAGVGRSALGGAEGGLEIYEHHSAHEEADASFDMARTRLEQVRAEHLVGTGHSGSTRIVPGHVITVTEHDISALNRGYVVTSVIHEASAAFSHVYHNELTCVPDSVPFRPPQPIRRFHQTVESAIVVGGENQEIDTESLGCVRVQFHWDRRGRHDQRSSCWVRVMQPWSGPQFGFQFIPRVGTEVLVSFVGGDLNRPVVIGCLPNLSNALPHLLPQDKTRSGIRTRSTPDSAGYNELMFDDAKDREAVFLRAQRNHEVNVLHDEILRVGNDRTDHVGANEDVSIGKHKSTKIGENEAHRVGGSRVVEVTGGATLAIGVDREVLVGGSSSETVEGTRSVVARGLHEVFVRASADGPGVSTHRVDGTYALSAARSLFVSAQDRIVLGAGASTITLTDEGITIRGPSIKIVGDDEVVATTGVSVITLDDSSATVKSTEVVAKSDGASMVLDGDAHLDGGRVLLNCGGRSVASQSDSSSVTIGEVSLQVAVPEGTEGPVTLVIGTPTGEVVERSGGSNHEVRLQGAPGERFTLLEVRDARNRPLGIHTSDDEER